MSTEHHDGVLADIREERQRAYELGQKHDHECTGHTTSVEEEYIAIVIAHVVCFDREEVDVESQRHYGNVIVDIELARQQHPCVAVEEEATAVERQSRHCSVDEERELYAPVLEHGADTADDETNEAPPPDSLVLEQLVGDYCHKVENQVYIKQAQQEPYRSIGERAYRRIEDDQERVEPSDIGNVAHLEPDHVEQIRHHDRGGQIKECKRDEKLVDLALYKTEESLVGLEEKA